MDIIASLVAVVIVCLTALRISNRYLAAKYGA